MPAVMMDIGVFMGAVCFGIILSAIVQRVGERNAMLISGILNASSGRGSTAFAPMISGLLSAGGLPLASLGLAVPVVSLALLCCEIQKYSNNIYLFFKMCAKITTTVGNMSALRQNVGRFVVPV